MFMFPEPTPVDYYIAEVPPIFLSDGVLLNGRPSPTHKCIAKQLRPIKRTLRDPVAPIKELDPRNLEASLEREKGGFVDDCNRGGFAIQETVKAMPKSLSRRLAQQSAISIFPRSPQYELWYIRNTREKRFIDRKSETPECERKSGKKFKNNVEEKNTIFIRVDDEPCKYLSAPFWWKDTKMDGKEDGDYHIKGPEATAVNDVPDRSVQSGKETSTKVHVSYCNGMKEDQDTRNAFKTRFDSDTRWQLLCETISFPETNEAREEELRRLAKPFLHDLHTWYSKNKPTKLTLPVNFKGKRPIPGKRFSHL